MDIPETSQPNPVAKLSFTQLRQAFQNVGIKVTKRSIQSYDYVSGVSGWKIDANGDVEFNAGTFRGTLTAGSIYIPNSVNPVFSVDSLGNVIANSLQRNDFHWFTLFESLDGYSKTFVGTGTITLGYQYWTAATSGTSGDNCALNKSLSNLGSFTWTKNRKIKFMFYAAGDAGLACQIGTGAMPGSSRKIAFYLSGQSGANFDLAAQFSNGSSVTTAVLLAGAVYNNYYEVEARFFAGSRIEYYVSGVLTATYTNFIPSGTDVSSWFLDFLLSTTGGVQQFGLYYYDFWQAN